MAVDVQPLIASKMMKGRVGNQRSIRWPLILLSHPIFRDSHFLLKYQLKRIEAYSSFSLYFYFFLFFIVIIRKILVINVIRLFTSIYDGENFLKLFNN